MNFLIKTIGGGGGKSKNKSKSLRYFSAQAKKILENYSGKIEHKAKAEGLSVNNLINKNVPRDHVQMARKVDSQVSNWRQKHARGRGHSVFVSVPWLGNKDKD